MDFSLVQTNQKKEGGKSRSEQSFNTAGNLYLKHEASDRTDSLISHINENPSQYTWQANTCMLQ